MMEDMWIPPHNLVSSACQRRMVEEGVLLCFSTHQENHRIPSCRLVCVKDFNMVGNTVSPLLTILRLFKISAPLKRK